MVLNIRQGEGASSSLFLELFSPDVRLYFFWGRRADAPTKQDNRCVDIASETGLVHTRSISSESVRVADRPTRFRKAMMMLFLEPYDDALFVTLSLSASFDVESVPR